MATKIQKMVYWTLFGYLLGLEHLRYKKLHTYSIEASLPRTTPASSNEPRGGASPVLLLLFLAEISSLFPLSF